MRGVNTGINQALLGSNPLATIQGLCEREGERNPDDSATSFQSCVTLSSPFECLFTSYHSYSPLLTLFIGSHSASASCLSCLVLFLLMFVSNTVFLPQL